MHDNGLGDGRIDPAEPGWKLIGLLKDPATGANLEARRHTRLYEKYLDAVDLSDTLAGRKVHINRRDLAQLFQARGLGQFDMSHMMEWIKKANGEDVGEAPTYLSKTCILAIKVAAHTPPGHARKLTILSVGAKLLRDVVEFQDLWIAMCNFLIGGAQRRPVRWLAGALATAKRHVEENGGLHRAVLLSHDSKPVAVPADQVCRAI
jgi:hypothetical protein